MWKKKKGYLGFWPSSVWNLFLVVPGNTGFFAVFYNTISRTFVRDLRGEKRVYVCMREIEWGRKTKKDQRKSNQRSILTSWRHCCWWRIASMPFSLSIQSSIQFNKVRRERRMFVCIFPYSLSLSFSNFLSIFWELSEYKKGRNRPGGLIHKVSESQVTQECERTEQNHRGDEREKTKDDTSWNKYCH